MAEERENENAPRTTDAGVDNGAALDPRASTENNDLNDLNARILELQEQRESTAKELRELTAEREKLAAGAVWSSKVNNMNAAELAALEEAIRNRQQVGVNGIKSREGVNGQPEVESDTV